MGVVELNMVVVLDTTKLDELKNKMDKINADML